MKNQIKTNKKDLQFEVLFDEIQRLVHAVVAGKLDVRADTSKFEGKYQELVQGINDTLDAIIGPLNVAAEYIDRISKGDIPEKITDEYRGNFNEIKNNINGLIDALNGLIEGAATMAKAAREGQLDTRVDTSRFHGAWKTIIEGLNDTAEGMVVSMREIGSVLEKLAAKDLTARVVGDYKGDYEILKNSVNQAIENIAEAMVQVAEAAEQVTSASNQISSGSQSLAEAASEQASSLEEISSSLEEITATTKQNADNAKQAAAMANDARNNADEGKKAMQRMFEAISKIKTSSDETERL